MYIEQGIKDISKKYGYENIVDLFLMWNTNYKLTILCRKNIVLKVL